MAETTVETETATENMRHHEHRLSLQHLMSPPLVWRTSRYSNNNPEPDMNPDPEEQPTRRRRKSDFEIYRDGKGVGSLGAQRTANSPGTQLNRERRMREKELKALEEEYLHGPGGRGGHSLSETETGHTEETGETERQGAPPLRRPHTLKPSATSLLTHSHPDPLPLLTPMPAPPLSLLHKKFSSGTTTPSKASVLAPNKPPAALNRTNKLSSIPVLPPPTSEPDISPLEHMRQLRPKFEALRPPSSPSHSSEAPPSPKSNPKPRRTSPQAKNRPKTTEDLISHYSFTLSHLPALTHHSRTATLTLTPTTSTHPGHITLNLRPESLHGSSAHTYTIPPHGGAVSITTLPSPSATSSRSTTAIYALEDLPLRHLPALRYAKSFVTLVQRATVVGRVEVRERCGGGVWVGLRWADGRFEATCGEGPEEVKVRISGERGEKVAVFVGGRREKEREMGKWEKAVDRAQRMWGACWRVVEDDVDKSLLLPSESEESTPPQPLRRRTTTTTTTTTTIHNPRQSYSPHSRSPNPSSHSQEPSPPPPKLTAHTNLPFQITPSTVFVPTIGWCRRDSATGWWSMLFLDGIRLEIDPSSGDAVWTDRGGDGERRLLKAGMKMREVRERVKRFVEKGL